MLRAKFENENQYISSNIYCTQCTDTSLYSIKVKLNLNYLSTYDLTI